jgi:hypothetical protein
LKNIKLDNGTDKWEINLKKGESVMKTMQKANKTDESNYELSMSYRFKEL